MKIPENVADIIETLENNGYEGYAVGGCVRDTVLGRTPGDWDITTSARPEQVKELFRRTVDTGIQHGTVTVLIGTESYEITTYRTDGEYEDHRHPKEVHFTPSLLEDLRRRDFTINAMAYNPREGVVDAFCGMSDLKNQCIRCVGDPCKRFEEDALRMLRGIRFAGQLQFDIEESTKEAIQKKAPTIENVSAERIRTELTKLLLSEGADRLMLAVSSGLSAFFLPEFDKMLSTLQNNPHHRYDVGRHCLEAVRHVNRLWKQSGMKDEKKHIQLVYAALLHDVAKPHCRTTDADGVDHFHGHNLAGEKEARIILRRLKFDNDTTDVVTKLIRHHDNRHENCRPDGKEREKGEGAMRRLMNRIGKELMPLLFLLQEADLLAQSPYMQDEKMEKLEAAKYCYKKICDGGDAVSIRDLAINGRDLMELGILPGPDLGKILQGLLEKVMDEPELNRKDKLIRIVRETHLLQV